MTFFELTVVLKNEFSTEDILEITETGNTKGGSITVQLTSCLTALESAT